MGDISTWNPVDNSNTTAPPDGWPEGMAPSAVNNSARAMMGAVRRWYDTVTAQLATFLPLSGGTITGNLTVNGRAALMNADFGPVASRKGFVDGTNGNASFDGSLNTGGDIHSGAGLFLGDPYLLFNGNTSASLGPVVIFDNTNCVSRLGAGNGGYYFENSAGGVVASISSAGALTTIGNITAPAFIGNVSVPASGPVTTGGTITGGQVTSTGNINAAGTVTAAQLVSTGTINASGDVYLGGHLAFDGSTPGQLGMYTPSGDIAIALFGSSTYQNQYYNNIHVFENSGRNFTYVTFGVAGCFNVSGTWGTFSDASLKDDVAPYERGLDAILGLSPISFRYLAGTPFADPERTLRYGLMAQDVAGIIPEMVGETTLETGGAVGTVFPGHLVYVLVNAAKELAAQNAALAARITALEGNHV